MRCKVCLKSFKRTVNKKCWNVYGMCITCCVIKHPNAYPKNIVMMTLTKAGLYKSPKNKFYVKINSYSSKSEAIKALSAYDLDAWVLKF